MGNIKTTDPQDEVFPMVNVDDTVIGKVLRKDANNNPNIIHRSTIVLIFSKKQELLIQKRSPTKDVSPNEWTVGVGGHVNYGDTYHSAAIRETYEEVGITIDPNRLKLLGKVLIRMPWECEYVQVYEYQLLGDVEIFMNKEEISVVKFVRISDLYAMLKDKTVIWSDFAREVLRHFPLLSAPV